MIEKLDEKEYTNRHSESQYTKIIIEAKLKTKCEINEK